MFKIAWLRAGKHHDIGGIPLFAPGPVAAVAGRYVAERIWPQIHRDHPELSGFALVDMQSQEEVFRWPLPAAAIDPSAETGKEPVSRE